MEMLQLNTVITQCLLNCSNNGKCIYNPIKNSFICDCIQNYTGSSCQIDKRPCNSNKLQCINNGECINNNDYNFTCNCSYPFYGNRCQFKQNLCKGITCSNKGVCYNNKTSYYCKCFKGYSGQICEIESNQAKTIKTVNNLSAYFSITFIVIFYASILLLDICHYWKPIKKYFKRIFIKNTKKIVLNDVQNEQQNEEQTEQIEQNEQQIEQNEQQIEQNEQQTEQNETFDEIKNKNSKN